jgi:hypothetical protein
METPVERLWAGSKQLKQLKISSSFQSQQQQRQRYIAATAVAMAAKKIIKEIGQQGGVRRARNKAAHPMASTPRE